MFFSENSISASAAARFVHHIVAHEHLKEFSIDREFFCFSVQIESDAYLVSSFSRASYGMPRMVAAEAASRWP
jgi:hypothetical protein